MTNKDHIAIIGGGLIGMMSAYYLLKAGFRITIFDKSNVASESTWAGGGILSPLYPWKYPDEVNQLAAYSQTHYSDLVQEIEKVSGVLAEYTVSGLLLDQVELNTLAFDWLKRYRRSCNSVDSNAPILRNLNQAKQYSLMPNVAQIRNPRLAKSMAIYLQRLKVRFATNVEVIGLNQLSNGQISVLTQEGAETFQKVVICAGAWSARILAKTGLNLAIKPVRGQMLLFKGIPGYLQNIILAHGHYLIPRRDGRVLVGSTMEDVGFDKSISQAALFELQNFVAEYVPGLLNFELEKQWAGLRPGSPTGIPLIDVHPEINNVYINTGHFRNGVVLAPASAKLLVDVMLEKPSFVDPEHYNYSRFIASERKVKPQS